MFWLPESPDFLYAKGKYDEAREVLLRMAKFNGVKVEIDQICLHPEDARANISYDAI